MKKFAALILFIVTMMSISFMTLPVKVCAEAKEVDVLEELENLSLDVEPFTAGGENGDFRRPVSKNEPMWIVHIDSWNCADPQKIIDLIPKDIRPYVVFNISL